MQGPKFLTAEQLLLTTLVVKLVATAALATMLVRYRRFRHILIFERRAWPDRLTFALSLGIPLTAGVVARLLLGYDAADLTLEGSFLVGLIAGPYAGATVGAMVGLPPLATANGPPCRLPSAAGLPAAASASCARRKRSGTSRRSSSPALPRRAWQHGPVSRDGLAGGAAAGADRRSICSVRRSACRWSDHHRLFVPHSRTSPWSWRMLVVLFATVLCVATPIKIWNNARIEHRLQEQEKLLLAAKIEALANQINPHFLFNTLTSISSLIRTAAGYRAHADHQAVRAAPPPDAQHRSFRLAARRARPRSTSTSTSRSCASAPAQVEKQIAPRPSTSSCRA